MKRLVSRVLVVAFALAVMAVAVAGLLLRGRMRCAGFAGGGVNREELPPAAADGVLRLATWNIRNFPLDERSPVPELGFVNRTNVCDLEEALAGLDADVIGVAEITDTRRFPPILQRAGGRRDYRIVFSSRGGHRLGVGWDDLRLEQVGKPLQVRELAEEGGRPALVVRLRSRRPGGLDLAVAQLHLKAGQEGFQERLRQVEALARWASSWVEEVGDDDLVVMGDFNTTGPVGGATADELATVDRTLARAGLRRLTNAGGCSSYWDGHRARDGVLEPSLIDHVYVHGLEELDRAEPVRPWLHCARADCGELISRPGQEDATYWDVSDHCPLTFEVADRDLD
jgi:exonuclease III